MHMPLTVSRAAHPPLEFRQRYVGVEATIHTARQDLQRALTPLSADGDLIDAAVTCLSELATNAVRHVTRGRVTESYVVAAALLRPRARLRIEVHDAEHAPLPVWPPRALLDVDSDSTSGRGLPIVSALSAAVGYTFTPGAGKLVWCELPVTVPAMSFRSQ
ncbi:ATP-binding protein [Streptomyces sp. NPDC008079]|uniref:ATP-binding protein n=1 Tax=Streptomyces sp. NPDC008079 TaxID=3364806 RepID=UPI0036E5B962